MSPWGLWDTSGATTEWIEDWAYAPFPDQRRYDGTAAGTTRVLDAGLVWEVRAQHRDVAVPESQKDTHMKDPTPISLLLGAVLLAGAVGVCKPAYADQFIRVVVEYTSDPFQAGV
jgi:hypothetical protein